MALRIDILDKKKDIENWIKEHRSMAYMCRELNCKPCTLKRYFKQLNISYSGNRGGKGYKTDPKKLSAKEYISSGSHIKSHKLRLKLIEEGIKDKKCEICGLSEWLGKDIALELHHKNGNHYDNNIDNLEVLCPNCHSHKHKYALVME